jgi:hypothetical protein
LRRGGEKGDKILSYRVILERKREHELAIKYKNLKTQFE